MNMRPERVLLTLRATVSPKMMIGAIVRHFRPVTCVAFFRANGCPEGGRQPIGGVDAKISSMVVSPSSDKHRQTQRTHAVATAWRRNASMLGDWRHCFF
jgi:hypothetical protein